MSFYRHHVFFCTNQRAPGEACCGNFNPQHMRDYMKKRTKELGIHREGGVRANVTGCLGRCDLGPTIVIYPDDVWYTYVDEKDIDDIINEHLIHGRVVTRLRI